MDFHKTSRGGHHFMKLFHNSFSSNEGLPEGRIVPPKRMNFLIKFQIGEGGGGPFSIQKFMLQILDLITRPFGIFPKIHPL